MSYRWPHADRNSKVGSLSLCSPHLPLYQRQTTEAFLNALIQEPKNHVWNLSDGDNYLTGWLHSKWLPLYVNLIVILSRFANRKHVHDSCISNENRLGSDVAVNRRLIIIRGYHVTDVTENVHNTEWIFLTCVKPTLCTQCLRNKASIRAETENKLRTCCRSIIWRGFRTYYWVASIKPPSVIIHHIHAPPAEVRLALDGQMSSSAEEILILDELPSDLSWKACVCAAAGRH